MKTHILITTILTEPLTQQHFKQSTDSYSLLDPSQQLNNAFDSMNVYLHLSWHLLARHALLTHIQLLHLFWR